MKRIDRPAAWLPVLALLALMTGCIKAKHTVVLMPDGSGRIDLRFAFSDEVIEQMKQDKSDPFEEIHPVSAGDAYEGIAAFTRPTITQKDKFTYMSFSAYFEDINKVQTVEFADASSAEYTYTRDGESATLTVKRGLMLSTIRGYDVVPDEDKPQMRLLMQGLEIAEKFVMPGRVVADKGITTDKNTASIAITTDNMVEGTGPVKDLKGKQALSLKVPAIDMDKDAIASFKKEFDDAVKAWQAYLKENQ